MAKRDDRIHIFFNRGAAKPKVFQITQEGYDAAAKRHPRLAKRVKATVAEFGTDFEPVAHTVDAAVGFAFPTETIREKATRLKWCHATGAGVDHLLPLDAWLPKGAILTNNSGVHTPRTMESAMMAILMLNSRIPAIVGHQQAKRWQPTFTSVVRGGTLLVIGTGGMGTGAARAGRTLGMKVIGVRRSGKAQRGFDKIVTTDKLDRHLPKADVVFITCPLTAETRGLIGKEQFALMKPSAGLVNFGRGAVVDAKALKAALTKGEISGALMDVFDPEPYPSSGPLWTAPNLIMTPHCLSDDAEHYLPRTLDLVFENLGRLLDGRKLKNRVDIKRAY